MEPQDGFVRQVLVRVPSRTPVEDEHLVLQGTCCHAASTRLTSNVTRCWSWQIQTVFSRACAPCQPVAACPAPCDPGICGQVLEPCSTSTLLSHQSPHNDFGPVMTVQSTKTPGQDRPTGTGKSLAFITTASGPVLSVRHTHHHAPVLPRAPASPELASLGRWELEAIASNQQEGHERRVRASEQLHVLDTLLPQQHLSEPARHAWPDDLSSAPTATPPHEVKAVMTQHAFSASTTGT